MKGFQLKKQLNLLKMCVTSLLCGPRADLWFIYLVIYLFLRISELLRT